MKHILEVFLYELIIFCEKIGVLTPYRYAKFMYLLKFRKRANQRIPSSINEKIMWLAFHTETKEWTRLADKFLVREYVKERGLEHILVKLHGAYNKPEDINFKKLPDSFVLKMNNGYGSVVLVKNKQQTSWEELLISMKSWSRKPFGVLTAEPHYRNIEPCILVEELLQNQDEAISTSIIDYKFWCFNGKVEYCFIVFNRDMNKKRANYSMYSLPNWESLDYKLNSKYVNNQFVPKPDCLDEMIKCAEILSKGFPVIRVDLYAVNSKVYFGELTFTSNGCRMAYFPNNVLNEMGDKIKLNI